MDEFPEKYLKDVMPHEFMGYTDTKAYQYKDVEVVEQYGCMTNFDDYKPWIGKEKNVHFWVKLVNGYAVGWNENPGRGWSFPVCKVK